MRGEGEQGVLPSETFAPLLKIWSKNNRKINITLEIFITIDFASPQKKKPGRKPVS